MSDPSGHLPAQQSDLVAVRKYAADLSPIALGVVAEVEKNNATFHEIFVALAYLEGRLKQTEDMLKFAWRSARKERCEHGNKERPCTECGI